LSWRWRGCAASPTPPDPALRNSARPGPSGPAPACLNVASELPHTPAIVADRPARHSSMMSSARHQATPDRPDSTQPAKNSGIGGSRLSEQFQDAPEEGLQEAADILESDSAEWVRRDQY
jgi:hypothetical protein